MKSKILTNFPTRMLNIICDTMVQDLGIDAEISHHGGTPTIKSEVGNIIYFKNSDSFRIFLKVPGKLGKSHITVKGTPGDLLQKVREIADE